MFSQIGSLLAVYFVLWWVVFFVTLPFGVRNRTEVDTVDDDVPGSDPGAPVTTLLARKALWATVASAAIFAVALYAYRSGWLEIGRLSKLLGFPL
ncbi:conserved hypothetical protein [Rhodopseudomonas palustris HaA2]|uniref:DUF1467 family protein n=1 Tax=Rhodopseudomonas palustris (strain HaA2) TaxID=316058 RepID=Q2IWW6_RHOP2|nr:DUF1467 family protein [Rhodopseudomonas palustris]ABD07294.1 conserved hypothetical protein [Rhodopseudomonas palustris HaA2]